MTVPTSDADRQTVIDHVQSRFDGWLLLALAAGATACWALLYRWYGLFENKNNTHFAFEKIPGYFDSPIIRRTLYLFLAIGLIYGAGYWVIRRSPSVSRPLKAGILAAAIGPGAINLALYPVGALDVFNYLIELKLTYFYDLNPYLETFKNFRSDPFALPAFLVDTRLFYGPVWLLVSGIPGLLVGYDDVLTLLIAMKAFNLGLLGLTAAAIARYHDDERRRWLAVYAFLANPLVLFEGVANAHNDVLMTAFLIGALLALQRRSAATGPLLAASALVKVFSVVIAPLILAAVLTRRWGARRIALTGVLTVVLAVGAAAPFWADGEMIGGVRDGMTESQEMNHVSPFSLAQQWEREREIDALVERQPGFANGRSTLQSRPLSQEAKDRLQRGFAAAFVVATLILAVKTARGRPFEAGAVDALMLFSLLLTNLYPWYLIPIVAVLALRRDAFGSLYLVVASTLGLVYYPFYVWAHFNSGWDKFHVHLFLALFLTAPMMLYLLAGFGRWVVVGLFAVRARMSNTLSSGPALSRRDRVNAS